MTSKATIEALLAAATRVAGDQDQREARAAARVVWVHERIAALKAAQESVDEAWARNLEALPDDHDDEREALPDPPEQAEVDAIIAEIEAVRDHDRWPRELYWGGV
jgi:hypothetical protein